MKKNDATLIQLLFEELYDLVICWGFSFHKNYVRLMLRNRKDIEEKGTIQASFIFNKITDSILSFFLSYSLCY